MTAPAWARQAIWYHLYPLGFLGAEPANPVPLPAGHPTAPRLRRLEGWLDYLADLGTDGLLLGPVLASETHGYDTVDYFRVDPRLGDEDDLRRLIAACHRRGLRVLLDGVFNHVARSFPPFADVRSRRAASPYARWFRLDFERPGPDGFAYETFEGHGHLVALNHAEPDVLELVASAALHWLERGIDGYRLDAAYAVPPAFWRAFAERVRARFPGAFLMGEVIHGDYAAFVREGALDSVTQYELWKAIWSSLNDRNFFELAWALKRHQEYCDAFVPFTFVGNHDVTRIASRLVDPRHLPHAIALLFALPGTPAIYAGDERGWHGVKHEREGGDAEIRPAFPATPADLDASGAEAYRLHQELIRVRRAHPFLPEGRVEVRHLTNQQIAFTVGGGSEALLAAFNLADEPTHLDLVDAGARAARLVAGAGEVQAAPPEPARIVLPPHGWALFTYPQPGGEGLGG